MVAAVHFRAELIYEFLQGSQLHRMSHSSEVTASQNYCSVQKRD